MEKLKIKLTECLAAECYTCSCIRWHDVGHMCNFRQSMMSLTEKYDAVLKILRTSLDNSSTGGFRNVANNTEKWEMQLEVNGKTVVFKGEWWQLGDAKIIMNGNPFIHAFENWGVWEIDIDPNSLTELHKLIK